MFFKMVDVFMMKQVVSPPFYDKVGDVYRVVFIMFRVAFVGKTCPIINITKLLILSIPLG